MSFAEVKKNFGYLGGKSEPACPQHLPIRQYLKDAAKEFEKK